MAKSFKFDEPLSVIIPAYREEENLPTTIKDTVTNARKISNNFEVVIVNDGSPDKTGEVAESLAKKYKEVRVFHHKVNQGLAATWRTAIKHAKKDVILYIEGDNQQPFKDQYELLKKIKGADLVLGYRSYRFDYTPTRKVFSYGFLFLIWLLFGLTYKDVGWSQVYRKKIFEKFEMKCVTPFWDTEVVIKALRNGFKVDEAKSYYRAREKGGTSLGNYKTAWKMFKEMIQMRLGYYD